MDDPLLTFLLKYKLALIFSNSNINYFIIPPTIWHTFISKSIMVVPLWWKYFLYSLQKEVDTLPAFAKIIRSSKQYISWSKEIQHIYLQKHSGQSKSIQLEIVYKCVYTYIYMKYTHTYVPIILWHQVLSKQKINFKLFLSKYGSGTEMVKI